MYYALKKEVRGKEKALITSAAARKEKPPQPITFSNYKLASMERPMAGATTFTITTFSITIHRSRHSA
jgi:hypothetical protein